MMICVQCAIILSLLTNYTYYMQLLATLKHNNLKNLVKFFVHHVASNCRQTSDLHYVFPKHSKVHFFTTTHFAQLLICCWTKRDENKYQSRLISWNYLYVVDFTIILCSHLLFILILTANLDYTAIILYTSLQFYKTDHHHKSHMIYKRLLWQTNKQ